MRSKRYTPEFKDQAVKLCQEKGVYHAHRELGVSTKSLYDWLSKIGSSPIDSKASHFELLKQVQDQAKQIARLKEEREILKKAAIFFSREENQ